MLCSRRKRKKNRDTQNKLRNVIKYTLLWKDGQKNEKINLAHASIAPLDQKHLNNA